MVVHRGSLPPGPQGLPLVGVLRDFRQNPPGFLHQVARDYGDVAYFKIARQHTYLLTHPDLIKDVLVTHQQRFKKSRLLERARIFLGDGLLTSEGEFHRRQRRLVQPAFHRERLASYAATMVERAAIARDRIQPGQPFDLQHAMMRLTLDIVSRTLFTAEVDSDADRIGEAVAAIIGVFETLMLPYSEYLEKLPIPAVRRFFRAKKILDDTIYGIIANRRHSGADTGDLLSMLLLAQDEEGTGGMTDQQVRDEAITLFVAGHETTAIALTWALYRLSQSEITQAAFHAELDRELGDRLPTFDDLPRLPYTAGIFAESLRLYPPAWAVGRKALEDHPVAGHVVPADAVILMSPYAVHRDPRWFEDPEAFRPQRWLTETERPRFAFFPFGGGVRVCIGERFALAEGALVLATLAQRWRFRLASTQPIGTKALFTLHPDRAPQLIAESRSVSGQ